MGRSSRFKIESCGGCEEVFMVGVEGFRECVVLDSSADYGEDVVFLCGVVVLTVVEDQVFKFWKSFHTIEDWLCS